MPKGKKKPHPWVRLRLPKNRATACRWVLFDNLDPRFGAVSPLFLRKKSTDRGVFDHNHIDYDQKPSCRGRCPQ
ncbi:MAG: hypothetical protein IKW07_01180, partial [Clostridia bacterium]|nr:hypothetical protein [Clostridia bacterium]